MTMTISTTITNDQKVLAELELKIRSEMSKLKRYKLSKEQLEKLYESAYHKYKACVVEGYAGGKDHYAQYKACERLLNQ